MAANLSIHRSDIAGYGVFVTEDVSKGKVLFIMKGRIVQFIASTKRDAMKHPHRVGVGKNLWMEPDTRFVRYINHSCNPNVGIRGRVTFVALRNIRKGEEITFDYSISEDSQWQMRCACGSKRCRGIIGGIRTLPRPVFDSYVPFVPRYFRRVYLQSRGTASQDV